MGCNDIRSHLENVGLEPKGDTLVLTVGAYDKIILTVVHGDIEIQEEIRLAIVCTMIDQSGKIGVELELHHHQISSKIEKHG